MEQKKLCLLYPLATEKAIRMIEAENMMTFVVERTASKTTIKQQIEKMYKVLVRKVNTNITAKGEKRAYAYLSRETPALDLATRLGLL